MNHSTSKDVKVLDELIDQVGVYRSGADLKKLFEFIKRFPKVAPFNAMLLHIQKPGSQYVASAFKWKSIFNRTINPGARPLVILWPFGPVRFVFELGDTQGDDPFPEELLRPFQTEGVLPKKKMERLLNNFRRDDITYHETDYGTGSAGFILRKAVIGPKKKATGKKVTKFRYDLVVNRRLSKEDKFATVAHELGHLYCGHLGTPNETWWPRRVNLYDNAREFEAESVSWLVCERAGIKNPSAKYLSGYLDEGAQIPEISLETVLKAAGLIESMTLRSLPKRK